jgi:hypothetical protein
MNLIHLNDFVLAKLLLLFTAIPQPENEAAQALNCQG